LNATDILIQIGGGVALLLWGVRMVRTGMTRAYGARLRQAIGACAARRLPAFAIGIGATLVLQSSTATTLIVTSFAGRALLAHSQKPLNVILVADTDLNVAEYAVCLQERRRVALVRAFMDEAERLAAA